MSDTKTNVALLCGGDSSEREISLKSARALHSALAPDRFNTLVYDVSQVRSNSTVLPLDESRLESDEIEALRAWWQKCSGEHTTWSELAARLQHDGAQVAFSSLHGGWGEDGTVQTLLEVAGIRFVGSPTRASLIAMDKRLCKLLARECGILVARGALVMSGEAAPFSGPCVVKPNGGGSSVGVTILREYDAAAFEAAVEAARADGSEALVEEFIEGIEVTVAVLESTEGLHALPVVEVVPHAEFYDFKAKYRAGGSTHICPARLSTEATARVQRDALTIFEALGCRGVARADFLVTPEETPYFLEINTLPGMTQTSLVPDAARAAGITFENLVQQLVADALQ
jgi:D-alanine-D-alanine ligase